MTIRAERKNMTIRVTELDYNRYIVKVDTSEGLRIQVKKTGTGISPFIAGQRQVDSQIMSVIQIWNKWDIISNVNVNSLAF